MTSVRIAECDEVPDDVVDHAAVTIMAGLVDFHCASIGLLLDDDICPIGRSSNVMCSCPPNDARAVRVREQARGRGASLQLHVLPVFEPERVGRSSRYRDVDHASGGVFVNGGGEAINGLNAVDS